MGGNFSPPQPTSVGRRGRGRAFGATRNFLNRKHTNESSASAPILELNHAVNQREKGIILGAPDVSPGLVPRATLADQDASAADQLPAETLDPETLSVRIAPVRR